jgi:hypothetical protein
MAIRAARLAWLALPISVAMRRGGRGCNGYTFSGFTNALGCFGVRGFFLKAEQLRMLTLILADSSATSWYGGPPSYDENTLHAIGTIGAIVAVIVFAWLWRMLRSSNDYNEYGHPENQKPLWIYVGGVAFFMGLMGAVQTRFSWAPDPLFLIMLGVGLFIIIVGVTTRKLKLYDWRKHWPRRS